MIAPPSGRPLAGVALAAVLVAAPGAAGTLEIHSADGKKIAAVKVIEGAEWCLHWNHSVTGGAVADCFEIRSGVMVLTRSYLHDFAAGLGHLPGRGVQRPAAHGGYWIEEIDEPVAGNALPLRVGSTSVGHHVIHDGGSLDLSARASGERVILRPASGD